MTRIFALWSAASCVAGVCNIVLWLVKPADYLMTGVWNIVDVAPMLTVVMMPVIAMLLLVRHIDECPVWQRYCTLALLVVVLMGTLAGLLTMPEWFVLPDLVAWHSTIPYANHILAWGALNGFATAAICAWHAICAWVGLSRRGLRQLRRP